MFFPFLLKKLNSNISNLMILSGACAQKILCLVKIAVWSPFGKVLFTGLTRHSLEMLLFMMKYSALPFSLLSISTWYSQQSIADYKWVAVSLDTFQVLMTNHFSIESVGKLKPLSTEA